MPTYEAHPAAQRMNAGRGIEWLSGGWTLFMAAPGAWLVIGVFCFVYLVIASSPGAMIATFFFPLVAAGLMECSRRVRDGGELKINAFFAGLRQRTGNLLVAGLLLLAGQLCGLAISGLIIIVGGGMSALSALQSTLNNNLANIGDLVPFTASLLLTMLVMLTFMFVLGMAAWFAPALILFDGLAPVAAMKASFSASLRNWLALAVYSVPAFILMCLAMLTVVGLPVAVPVIAASVYLSYLDIFHGAYK